MGFQKTTEVIKRKITLEMLICPIDGCLKTIERCHECDNLKAEDTKHVYCECGYGE